MNNDLFFSYNCKTGNILWNDRSVVRFDSYSGGIYFWIKDRGVKRFLVQTELVELSKTIKWLIEQHGCDFGEEMRRAAYSYLTNAA